MKKILTLVLITAFGTSLLAQPENHEERKKKMESMRIAFITDALDLSPEEAQQFWPLFNEKSKKTDELRAGTFKKMIKMHQEGKTIDDMSDKELNEQMNLMLENEEKIARINKEYHQKFIDLIGVKKTAKLYKAEKDFHKELLQHFRGGRKGKGKGQEHNGQH